MLVRALLVLLVLLLMMVMMVVMMNVLFGISSFAHAAAGVTVCNRTRPAACCEVLLLLLPIILYSCYLMLYDTSGLLDSRPGHHLRHVRSPFIPFQSHSTILSLLY
jgi:hypothetical protein